MIAVVVACGQDTHAARRLGHFFVFVNLVRTVIFPCFDAPTLSHTAPVRYSRYVAGRGGLPYVARRAAFRYDRDGPFWRRFYFLSGNTKKHYSSQNLEKSTLYPRQKVAEIGAFLTYTQCYTLHYKEKPLRT